MTEIFDIWELFPPEILTTDPVTMVTSQIQENAINVLDFFQGLKVTPKERIVEITSMVQLVMDFLFCSDISKSDDIMKHLEESFESFKAQGWTQISFNYIHTCHSVKHLLQSVIDIAVKKGILDQFDYERFLGIKTYQIKNRDEELKMLSRLKQIAPSNNLLFKGIRPSQFLLEQVTKKIASHENWSCFSPSISVASCFLRWRSSKTSSWVLLVINREKLFKRTPFIFSGADNSAYDQIDSNSDVSQLRELRLLRTDELQACLKNKWIIDIHQETPEVIPTDCIEYIFQFPSGGLKN